MLADLPLVRTRGRVKISNGWSGVILARHLPFLTVKKALPAKTKLNKIPVICMIAGMLAKFRNRKSLESCKYTFLARELM